MTNSETLLKIFDLRHRELSRSCTREAVEDEGGGNEGVIAVAVSKDGYECWRESAVDLILWWIGGQLK